MCIGKSSLLVILIVTPQKQMTFLGPYLDENQCRDPIKVCEKRDQSTVCYISRCLAVRMANAYIHSSEL
jgi:hypothetical protein